MEFYERVSGARMHAAFYRPGYNFLDSLSIFLLEDINFFTNNAFTSINEINSLLVENKVWKKRLVGVGKLPQQMALKGNITGVLLRSTGLMHDVRLNKLESYANYPFIKMTSYISTQGDCYDRYILRIAEIYESLNITNQVILKLKKTSQSKVKFFKDNRSKVYKNMESLIKHFKY